MTKKPRMSLLRRAESDLRSRRQGAVCRVCAHKNKAEIDNDLTEFFALKKEGKSISFSWLAEMHIKEEYGLVISRQSLHRHVSLHLLP